MFCDELGIPGNATNTLTPKSFAFFNSLSVGYLYKIEL